MAHEFSLAYLTVGDLEPSAQVYVAKAAGYDHVGLRPIPMGLPNEPNLDIAHDKVLRRNLDEALAETGLDVWDIELARVMDGVDYESYVPAMQVGAELGAKVLLSSVWTTDHQAQVDGLRKVSRLAADHGLKVVSEFVPLSSVRTLAEMAELIREVDEPNLGMLVDAYHFDRGGATFEQLEALPKQWFPMIHACDCPSAKPEDLEQLREEVRERRLYVGEGCVPVAEILRHLGPDVVVSIEQPHLRREARYGETEFARRSLQEAKRYLEANGLG